MRPSDEGREVKEMRRFGWLLLVLCSIAWTQEQQVISLRYEVGWSEKGLWGFMLGVPRLAESAKLENVKLPSVSNVSLFAAKFVDGKRFFAVTKRQNKLVLYADTNGNNNLTDERPFEMSRQNSNAMVAGPIPMRIKLNGKTVTRHVGAMFIEIKDKRVPLRSLLFLFAANRWTGKLFWEGKQIPVTVIDKNCDGVISEDDSLILGSAVTKGSPILLTDFKEKRLPARGQVGINGKFFRFEVSPDGEKLICEPLKVQTATVKFDGEQLMLIVEGGGKKWLLEGKEGKLITPIGEFQLLKVNLTRKDKQRQLWMVEANAFGPAAPRFSIPDSGTMLDIEPLKLSLHYAQKGDQCEFSLDIKTANGMSVNMLLAKGRLPPEPKLRLSSLDGKIVAESKFHYG